MVDGSLGRAVFQGSPGEVFRGSCGAKERERESERSERRGASCSSVFRLASAFRVLFYTHSISVSLFSVLFSCLALSCCAFVSQSVPRLLDIWMHTKSLLRRTRKRPRKSSSRFASLVKRMRDFAYRTPSRFPFSLSLSSFISPSILCLPRLPPLFLSSFSIFRKGRGTHRSSS